MLTGIVQSLPMKVAAVESVAPMFLLRSVEMLLSPRLSRVNFVGCDDGIESAEVRLANRVTGRM